MKASRIVIVVVVLVLVAIIALYAIGALTTPQSNSTWHSAAEYPLQIGGTLAVGGQQCVNDTSSIYCVGGMDANGGPRDDAFQSSAVSSTATNITSWRSEPIYPQNVNGHACAVSSGFIYCVGGSYDDAGDDIASSYYAALYANGSVGAWKGTTPYPVPIDTEYCVTATGHIYCIAGDNETDGNNDDAIYTNSVYYAPVSSTGIGAWANTTAYPSAVTVPSCLASGGYVYCVGGADQNGNAISTSYFAPLTPTGVGAWSSTTSYPVAASGQACAIASGYIYCVGGETTSGSFTNAVYSAPVSSGGIGSWKLAPSYPNSVQTECVISSGYMYCVGGQDNSQIGEDPAVYFAPLTSLTG